ncbi:MAG: hypothetical protein BWZ01_03208 [Deltaproteobacteria bacterium ADurb.BinA179]|nr:MAG: hypothetical protein BWZ01_03208 [Deltaproteobacteria bacterium ADurb.BinA179]
MGKGGGFPEEVYGEAVVEALAQGAAVRFPDPLLEVSVNPERKDRVVKDLSGIIADVVGKELPVRGREQLTPDHGPVGIRIEDNPDLLCGGCACDEIVFPDDGLPVFHEVLECISLPELGDPGASVFASFEAVFPEPAGKEKGPLMADGGLPGKVNVEEFLQPGKIGERVLREIRIIEKCNTRVPRRRGKLFFYPGRGSGFRLNGPFAGFLRALMGLLLHHVDDLSLDEQGDEEAEDLGVHEVPPDDQLVLENEVEHLAGRKRGHILQGAVIEKHHLGIDVYGYIAVHTDLAVLERDALPHVTLFCPHAKREVDPPVVRAQIFPELWKIIEM